MKEEKAKEPNNPDNAGKQGGTGMVQRRWPWVTLILVLLFALLLLLVVSLEQLPAVLCVTKNPELARAPAQVNWEKYPYLVEDQVIVTGPADKVRDVIDGLGLVSIQECRLNYFRSSRRDDEGRPPYVFTKAERRKLTTNLYQIPEGQRLKDVIIGINEVGRTVKVFADFNLLFGSPLSVCGNPSHIPIGSPFGTPELLPVGEAEAAKLFWEQWAFRQIGVDPSFKNTLLGATILHRGEGTLVGVFDTSPFLDPWDDPENQGRSGVLEAPETVKWVHPTMDVEPLALKVSYPEWVAVLPPPELPARTVPMTPALTASVTLALTASGPPPPDIRDHGLYVAGLVHAVAPASEIRLIRVLDEWGCGDLFTLNTALASFVGEVEAERRAAGELGPEADQPLKGVVINLSLGIANSDPERIPMLSECRDASSPDEIVGLCSVLKDARDKGAVIVASAGNDGGEREIPAAFGRELVIGVGASSINRKPACFSNEWDVLAPGGPDDSMDDGSCVPDVHECTGDCHQGVISLVLFPPRGDAYWPTHYAYWSGTSFSAPLVSGLAALLLQAGVPPDEVDEYIMGFGGSTVIDIPATLTK